MRDEGGVLGVTDEVDELPIAFSKVDDQDVVAVEDDVGRGWFNCKCGHRRFSFYVRDCGDGRLPSRVIPG